MNFPYFSWCIHVTRGPIFNRRTPNFFLREANANFAGELLDLALASCVGQAVESRAVLLRHGVADQLFSLIKRVFGFLLKTSGCFWLSSKALPENLQSLEKLSCCMWLLVFMYVRDMSCPGLVTIRLNNNSLQNSTSYIHS